MIYMIPLTIAKNSHWQMRTHTLTSLILTLTLIITTFNFPASNAKQTQPISDILNVIKTYDETEIHVSGLMVLAGALCFIASSISSAGGIGGGGLFIPILTIVAGLDLKTASSLSAFMVTGGSIANVMCNLCIKTSSKFGGKSLIDYDIALLSEPFMLLGVSIGVICNLVFPEWLITLLFALFLSWSASKTCNTGFMFWKIESEENREKEGLRSIEEQLLVLDENDNNLKTPWLKLAVLLLIWFSFFSLYILRGNKYGQSIIPLEPCGVGYWILSSIQIPLALAFTAWIAFRKESHQDQNQIQEGPCHSINGQSSKLIFPVIALLAGMLGGVFGIGGGMLISPFLLQVGLAPEVTAATCSFMVFFSSIMSALQYLLLGMENIQAALILAIICFVASLIGLLVVQRAIQNYGRPSLIVFSVSIVMTLSILLMTSFGAIEIWRDYKSGKYMGFKPPC